MNATVFDAFTSHTNDSYDVCNEFDQNDTSFVTFYAVITGLLILCNCVLLSGIALSWRVLKQNIVYSYLISCILSEICFCLASAYQIYQSDFNGESIWVIGGTLQRYDKDDIVHHNVMHNNAYRKGLIVSLIINREFNICALIYAVSDNVQFVGRYSELVLKNSSHQRQNASKAVKFLRGKKCRAAFLIAMTWIIPIGLSLPVAFDWSCVEYCLCLPALRTTITCFAPEGSSVVCSRQWLPLVHSYIIVITSFYVCGLAMMFLMLGRTIRKFYRAYTPKKSRVNFTESRRKRVGEINALGRRTSKGGLKSSVRESDKEKKTPQSIHTVSQNPSNDIVQPSAVRWTPPTTLDVDNLDMPSNSMNKKLYSPVTTLPRSKRRPPLHSTIKLLIVLTTTLLISVTPLMCVLFIDVASPESDKIPRIIFLSAIALSYVQAASLPVILLKYMRGLRKACVNILLKCPCLYTTVVEQKPNPVQQRSIPEQSKKTKNKQIVPCEVPKIPQLQEEKTTEEDITTHTEHENVSKTTESTEKFADTATEINKESSGVISHKFEIESSNAIIETSL